MQCILSKMKSSLVFLGVLVLVTGYSNALMCYSCEGNSTVCPLTPTAAQLNNMVKQNCTSVLATVCAKYSINFINGESYTYRACENSYIGGTSNGQPFCTFVKSLYQPIVAKELIAAPDCVSCDTVDCNT